MQTPIPTLRSSMPYLKGSAAADLADIWAWNRRSFRECDQVNPLIGFAARKFRRVNQLHPAKGGDPAAAAQLIGDLAAPLFEQVKRHYCPALQSRTLNATSAPVCCPKSIFSSLKKVARDCSGIEHCAFEYISMLNMNVRAVSERNLS